MATAKNLILPTTSIDYFNMNWYEQASLDKIYTKQDMIRMGADGYLSSAMLLYIPIAKITGKDPIPSTFVDQEGKEQKFKKGRKITQPIEVLWNKGDDVFVLYSGNHRLRQAEINGEQSIRAFVGLESDNIDDFIYLSKSYELV
jgi:hypothetical protein